MDGSRLSSEAMATSVTSGKAMGSAMKSEGKEEGLAELFKLNQIWYRMPPTLSLVSKRTVTRCNFQQLSYPAPLQQQIASLIFNTGEFQINGKTSYLCIQAGIDKNSTANTAIFNVGDADANASARNNAHAFLGQGGIQNIFEEITFLSASGTEVDRQQNKGLQNAHVTKNRMSQQWYDTAGELQGFPGGTFQDNYDNKGWPGMVQALDGSLIAEAASPHLIPTRGYNERVWSKEWIATRQSGNVPNGAVTAPNNPFDSTKPYLWPSYVGSQDVSYDTTYHAIYNANPSNAPWFIVPLADILGMFNPYMNALIPSQVLAGGRLEIRFKNMSESLIAAGPSFSAAAVGAGAATFAGGLSLTNANAFLNSLTIQNIYLLLDSFQLNEGTLQRLNEAAAGEEGLSLMFDTWDWTQTPASTLSVEAQVSQARSRILRSFCVVRDAGQRTNPFANSLASEAAIRRQSACAGKGYSLTGTDPAVAGDISQILVNNYQAQLGSLYFPQQPLTTVEEYVMNAYYMWSRSYADPNETNAMSVSEFMGANGRNMFVGGGVYAPVQASDYSTPPAGVTPTDFTSQVKTTVDEATTLTQLDTAGYLNRTAPWAINWGSATYGFLAERSQLLQLSGLPISNARLLRHRFTFNYNPASGTSRTIDCFTEYTRVGKVFLGGRIVMRE